MDNHISEERLIEIEMAIANLEHIVDDLNTVIIAQGKQLELLKKQNSYLLQLCHDNDIKPLSEDTPPPHY